DALLLVDFAAKGRPRRILDLGCGSGVVAVALLAADPAASAVGLELQPGLAELARRNGVENGLGARLRIVEGDLRDPDDLGEFDAVVCNPPFFRGRTAPAPERALARHEIACSLADVAAAARRHVGPRGYAALVYPAERTTELIGA